MKNNNIKEVVLFTIRDIEKTVLFKDIKPAIKETIPQILGRIKQFQNSKDEKFNMVFLDNIQAYAESIGLK